MIPCRDSKPWRNLSTPLTYRPLRPVPPKAKGKRERETVKPISGLDVDALLRSDAPKKAKPEPSSATTRRKAVGSPGEHGRKGHSPAGTPSATAAEEALFRVEPDNAIPTFKRAMQNTSSTAEIESAAAQMGEIVTRLVADSLGDQNYAQACEDLSVLRDELIAFEEPGVYNTFIRDFKRRLLDGELGGDRRLMWREIRTMRLGLIDDRESEVSDVTADDAAAVSLACCLSLVHVSG